MAKTKKRTTKAKKRTTKAKKRTIKGSEWLELLDQRERIRILQITDTDGNKHLEEPLEGTACHTRIPDDWKVQIEITPAPEDPELGDAGDKPPADTETTDPGAGEPERARDDEGKFEGDDPATKDVNEAWEGGKPPGDADKDPPSSDTPDE